MAVADARPRAGPAARAAGAAARPARRDRRPPDRRRRRAGRRRSGATRDARVEEIDFVERRLARRPARPGRRARTAPTTSSRTPRRADFDDSGWRVLAPGGDACCGSPTAASASTGTGSRSRSPSGSATLDSTGATVVFEVVVDDYAEVWVERRAAARARRHAAARWSAASTRPTASCSRATRGPASASRSRSSASTARSRPRRATTSGCAPRRSTSTRPSARAAGARRAARASTATIVPGRTARAGRRRLRVHRGPGLDADGALLFSSPNTNAIYRWTPSRRASPSSAPRAATPASTSAATTSRAPTGSTFDPEGRLTICQHGNRRVDPRQPARRHHRAGRPLRGPAAQQPERPRLPLRRHAVLHRPAVRAARACSTTPTRSCRSAASSASRDGEVALVDRRARGPERARLLARRAVPLRRQLGPRAQGRHALRRSTTGDALGEVLYDMTDAPGEDAIDGSRSTPTGNLYVCGPGGIWVLSPEGEQLGTAAAARGAAQPRLGRRRRPHPLRHRADERLPARGSDREEDDMSKGPRARGRRSRTSSCPTRTATLHRLSELQGDDLHGAACSAAASTARASASTSARCCRFHEWCAGRVHRARHRPARTTCTTSSG